MRWRFRFLHRCWCKFSRTDVLENVSNHAKRFWFVFCEVIGNTGLNRVNLCSTQILSGNHFASGCFDQRWPCKENGSIAFDNNRLIAHSRDVCSACSARAKNGCNLRYTVTRHTCLIAEDAPKVPNVWEHFVLHGQKRPTRINEIDAWKMILMSNRLRTNVFLDRHWIIGATFDRCIVGNEEDFTAMDTADASDDACRMCTAIVEVVGC